ncbi:MAG: hypothetical protein ACYDA3_10845 [Gaiellaceae bacterium]
MKKISVLLPALIALPVALLPAAARGVPSARPLTTQPNVYDDIDVTLTDSKIVLSGKVGNRGNGVNFHIRNTGKRPHNFTLLAQGVVIGLGHTGLGSPTLKPNQSFVLQVFLDYRGDFTYRSTLRTDRAKPGMHGVFTVS